MERADIHFLLDIKPTDSVLTIIRNAAPAPAELAFVGQQLMGAPTVLFTMATMTDVALAEEPNHIIAVLGDILVCAEQLSGSYSFKNGVLVLDTFTKNPPECMGIIPYMMILIHRLSKLELL
jgi:hypothetical protein